MLAVATQKFLVIDGAEWAGSFAFNAFFALFPLIILIATVASFFVDRRGAAQVIVTYGELYVPLDAVTKTRIFGAVTEVVQAREKVGVVALALLIWSVLQCFTTLIRITHHAWGDAEKSWWRLPLKGLLLLSVAVVAALSSLAAPVVLSVGRDWFFPGSELHAGIYAIWRFVLPSIVVFLSLLLFYRYAPRKRATIAQVWPAALIATLLIKITESLFVVYLNNFASLNAVYGTLGGVMALLLWIYLAGCIFIFGSCLCAAQSVAEGTALANTNAHAIACETTTGVNPLERAGGELNT